MKKVFTLAFSLMLFFTSFAKTVSMDEARIVADNYQRNYAKVQTLTLRSSDMLTHNGIVTAYVFNYEPQGFVIVSADDAAIPVLAQSNTGFFGTSEQNPAATSWINKRSEEIAFIVSANLSNRETIKEWNKIRNNNFAKGTNDVPQMLSTTWDQGCGYNDLCPEDATATMICKHALTGCVATSMSQIMKFYQFPAKGLLSHTYVSRLYGTQSVDYSNTTYDWANMANSVTVQGGSPAVANIMYSAGVSVNMNYDKNGSGAFSSDVPYAFVTYFNYDESVRQVKMSDYTQTNWIELLKGELQEGRPCYYSGTDPSQGGHAWVCDGWRSSDNKFHFNWGWSGSSNGYYAIGSLSAGGYTFSNDNAAVIGIKPGNTNLIVRFDNITRNQQVPRIPAFHITGKMLAGTATDITLYIDGKQIQAGLAASFSYDWNTLATPLGEHTIKVVATNGTATSTHEVLVNVTDWIPQATAFTTASRGLRHISAVDENVAWAVAYDGSGSQARVQDFTRTENGGASWTSGKIAGVSGLEFSMICGVNKDTAYAAMFKSTTGAQGIYATFNKGKNWARQTTAAFNSATSFPNVVHFFNRNDGFCMGDPMNGEFELYTTSNGGQTWTLVPGANIPDPLDAQEYGTTGHYDAIGNELWFGTNRGRVFHTTDKGLTWTAVQTPISLSGTDGSFDVRFLTSMHGIGIERTNTSHRLAETFDGGVTWNLINVTGKMGENDICAVPGSTNAWISTEADASDIPNLGIYYSFDGGHSWGKYPGTDSTQYLCLGFVNDHCGWAGGFSYNADNLGIYKFIGKLLPEYEVYPVGKLTATVASTDVHLSWTAPPTLANPPVGYKIYRNDVLLTATPITGQTYNDVSVPSGTYTYCVEAVFSAASSERMCKDVTIVNATPNYNESKIVISQRSGLLTVQSPEAFDQVRIVNSVGQVVYQNNNRNQELTIITQQLPTGVYVVQVKSGSDSFAKKVLIVK